MQEFIVYLQDKILYASSLEDLKEFSGTFNINDSEQRLATFGEFNQGSVKTKVCLFYKWQILQMFKF